MAVSANQLNKISFFPISNPTVLVALPVLFLFFGVMYIQSKRIIKTTQLAFITQKFKQFLFNIHVNFKPKKDKCESCKKFDSNVAGCCLKCFGYSAYEPKACKAYEGSGEVIKSQAEVMIDYCFGVRNTESIKPCPGGKGTGIELEGEQK